MLEVDYGKPSEMSCFVILDSTLLLNWKIVIVMILQMLSNTFVLMFLFFV